MHREIERKFLVSGRGWRKDADRGTIIRQAYLVITDALSVRIRTVGKTRAFLTIKSGRSAISRSEFEYPVSFKDAQRLMKLRTGRVIVKRRYTVRVGKARFEVDVFEHHHKGLVIAEIELPSRTAHVPRPDWLGKEVTGKKPYYNANLART